MLEETLQICQQMWSDDDGPYDGKHYQLAETICQPQPIRRPPILIGGSGEKKTLRMVAQYADVWNASSSLEELPHKLDVLAQALRRRRPGLRRHPADRRVLRRSVRRRRRLSAHARPVRRPRLRHHQHRAACQATPTPRAG